MKIADIKKALDMINGKPVLVSGRSGNIALIVNESENIGYDIAFSSQSSLKIVKFKREPYQCFEIMTGYERLTLKQGQFARAELIKRFIPELEYTL